MQEYNFNLIILCFRGDILLFLTGQDEIEATVRSIRDISKSLPSDSAVIVPHAMYANMPTGQQLKIFRPSNAVNALKWKET